VTISRDDWMVVKMEYIDGGADTFGVCIFCLILWILHRVIRDYLFEHITEGSDLASLNTIRSIIASVKTIQRINHEIVIRRCEIHSVIDIKMML
jgi:divalent metal cation (Fe/Co/Zn/Cd) transporter